MDLQTNDPGRRSVGGAAVPSGTVPVCAEVAVTVEGIRLSGATTGSGRTFQEETHTLLILPRGAVLELATPVLSDQGVALMRTGTGKQVQCRVAHVRPRPNAKAYVELEFMEPAAGFWEASNAESPVSEPQAAPSPLPALKSPPPLEMPLAQHVSASEAAASRIPATESAAPVYSQTNQVKSANEVLGIHEAPQRTEKRKISQPTQAPVAVRETSSHTAPFSVLGGGLTAPPARPEGTLLLNSSLSMAAEPAGRGQGVSRILVFASVAAVVVAGVSVGAMFYFRGQSAATEQAELAAPPTPASPPEAFTTSGVAAAPSEAAPVNAVVPPTVPPPANVPAKQTVTQAPAAPAPIRPATASAEKTAVVSQAPSRRQVTSGALSAPIVKRPSAVPGEEPAPTVEVLSEAMPPGGNLGALVPSVSRTVPAAALSSAQPLKPEGSGGNVKPPQLVKSAPPGYPPVARQRKMEGDVAIEASIDASGNVANVRVASGPAFFHQVALDAVRNWKYQPATLNGQPVSADVLIVLKFRINN